MTTAPAQHTVQIETPLDVSAFIRLRVVEMGLTSVQLVALLGHSKASLISKVMNGRACFSKSSYFENVCEFLKISQSQQEAIVRAETGRTQKSRYRQDAPEEAP